MQCDAIVLSGGRSARLNFVSKAEFLVESSTLLERTLAAVRSARHVTVVGPEPSFPLPDGTVLVREEPAFGGPVAALGAALSAAQHRTVSNTVVVLACDMPHVGVAVPILLAALSSAQQYDGVLAVERDGDGVLRRQPLAAAYRTSALCTALENARKGVDSAQHAANPLSGMSLFRLIEDMNLLDVMVPRDATADVDTWEDAERLGATPPATTGAAAVPGLVDGHALAPPTPA